MNRLTIALLLFFSSLTLNAQWIPLGNDISGDGSGDQFGSHVAINATGSIVAIGAARNDSNGTDAGHVKVLGWDGQDWNVLGEPIEGLAQENRAEAVALDSSGHIVAVGAAPFGFSGLEGNVRVFEWDGTTWNQRGSTFTGPAGNSFGRDVQLSTNGNIVSISASSFGDNVGRTRVFAWNGTDWDQLGAAIDGEAATDYSGRSTSLNSDGTVLAIGATGNDDVSNQSGHVRVYVWDGANWIQRGEDLDGVAFIARFGTSVCLSDDGNRLAVGSPGRDIYVDSADNGEVTVYDWNGNSWQQIGQALADGVGSLDNFGETVSLSGDGNILAVGALEYTESTGTVRIYELINGQWDKMGPDLNGVNYGEKFGDAVAVSSDGNVMISGATTPVINDVVQPGFARVYKRTDPDITLSINVMLEGPYQSATGLMSDHLRSNNFIPLSDPYTDFGYSFNGLLADENVLEPEQLADLGNNSIVDWIIIELRSPTSPSTIIQSKPALVLKNGNVISPTGTDHISFYNTGVTDVYVVVKHRNHFGIRTLNTYPIGVIDINLSNTDPIFGSNPVNVVDGVNVMIAGDANGDGQVNSFDKNIFWRVENGLLFDYLNTKADFNLDGEVNTVDMNLRWRINNSKSEQLD